VEDDLSEAILKRASLKELKILLHDRRLYASLPWGNWWMKESRRL
jgi:hypothetical protein